MHTVHNSNYSHSLNRSKQNTIKTHCIKIAQMGSDHYHRSHGSNC
jgi:hypothetical protein